MAENFGERNRNEWNRDPDREQREWSQGRNREQQFHQPGGYGYGQSGYYGQGGYGQGGGGYGHQGYGQHGYGQGYGRESYRESNWDQQMGPGGYLSSGIQGGYGQGGYGYTSGFGGGQEFGGGYGRSEFDRGLGTRGISYSSATAGRFVGRGPKNYRRSDDRIREEVNEELTRHPDIDASEIEVQVQNGEVTLTGKVEDRHQKRLAEDLAERCSGVNDVHNQLKVDKGFFAKLFGGGEEDRERDRATLSGSERSTTSRPRSTSTTR